MLLKTNKGELGIIISKNEGFYKDLGYWNDFKRSRDVVSRNCEYNLNKNTI